MQRYRPVRIEVGPETAPHRWEDYLRLSGAGQRQHTPWRGNESRSHALAGVDDANAFRR
jgi:hypothetical protein